MKKLLFLTLFLVLMICSSANGLQKDMYGNQLWTVQTPLPCNQEADRSFERGLALLHHMTYVGARTIFAEASQ